MTGFQRMVAIPQDEYLNMSSSIQQVRQPLEQQFHKVERQYYVDENIRDPYRRLVMQSSLLDEMKNLKEQMRNSLSAATPKPYRNRALALLQNVEHFLHYNDKGEIYDADKKEAITGSRVEDLINHAVRDRRRNMTPTGWSHFLSVLREHNIPKSILNRYTLDELEGKLTPLVKEEVVSPAKHFSRIPRFTANRKAKTEAIDFLKKFKHG